MGAVLTVVLPDDTEQVLDAPAGWTVMEVIRDHGLPLKAECGGCCACATCHVYVLDAAPPHDPADDEETDRLDTAQAVDARSRLACRLILRTGERLRVKIAPGSEP